jgi:futalosine hydrolase
MRTSGPLPTRPLVTRPFTSYGLLESGQCAADAQALGFALAEAGGEKIFGQLAWDAAAELARLGLDPAGLETATSLSVSGVTADAQRAAELFSRFGAGLENMEGFALAYACRLAGLPFAELRAVSNRVGSRPPLDWDLAGALAALGAAARRLLAQNAP